MSEPEFEAEQEQAAAREAGGIGGEVSYDRLGEEDEKVDAAQAPLIEAGEGESEGFELAEQELEEHASHGDMHAAGRVLEDAPRQSEDERATRAADGGAVRSSERPED